MAFETCLDSPRHYVGGGPLRQQNEKGILGVPFLVFVVCRNPSRRALEIRADFRSYPVGARPDGRWKYTLTFVRILLEPVLTGDGNTHLL